MKGNDPNASGASRSKPARYKNGASGGNGIQKKVSFDKEGNEVRP